MACRHLPQLLRRVLPISVFMESPTELDLRVPMTKESVLLAGYSEPYVLLPASWFLLHVDTGRGIQGSRIPSVLGPEFCSIMSPFPTPRRSSNQGSRAERREQVTVTPRPSSSESLELGPKQSGILSVASPPHVVSREHLCQPCSWSLTRNVSFSGSF